MRFGLSDEIIACLEAFAKSEPELRSLILFGSRSRGDFRDGSDIDLAIDAPNMSSETFGRLCSKLEELPILFPIDIVRMDASTEKELLLRIARDGIVLAGEWHRESK